MQPKLEEIEVEASAGDNHDFAIEHAPRRQLLSERLKQFGEVSVQRLRLPALDLDLGAVPEDQGAKAIPLRFEDEGIARRQCIDALRQHWQNGRIDRKVHAS